MFSKSCKYAIKAVLFIAKESLENKRMQIDVIADKIDSPKAFTYKILQRLVKFGIVKSVKGNSGGFEIEEKTLNNLKLGDIVNAIDGDEMYMDCVLGLTHCNNLRPCPVHHKFKSIKGKLTKTLKETKITDLVEGLKEELTFLKI